MRCQRCPKPATLHITEILEPEKFEQFHFCEDCAQKHFFDPSSTIVKELSTPADPGAKISSMDDDPEMIELQKLKCPHCGVQFKDFRASGRLGCAHDYEIYRKHLVTLLENIHGEKAHVGKKPRRMLGNSPTEPMPMVDVSQLKKLLQFAVQKEDYEEAARIRDRIRKMEEVTAAS